MYRIFQFKHSHLSILAFSIIVAVPIGIFLLTPAKNIETSYQYPLHWIYFVAYLVTILKALLLLFCRCIVTVPSCLLLGILQHQQSMQHPKALKLVTRWAQNYDFIAKLFYRATLAPKETVNTFFCLCFFLFVSLQ